MNQETTSNPRSSAVTEKLSWEISPISSWVLGFGLIVFASVNGGAFDTGVFGQIGTFAWLLLALGLLLGLFPVNQPGPDGWAATGLWLGLLAWAALGLLWTDSPDKTWVEVARLATYAGVFLLALVSRGRESLRNQIGSVAAGVTVVAAVALLSRFQPDIWPSATETGRTLTSEAARLSFPLGYWNGLAALVAIGLASLIETAAGARQLFLRALATAGLPILVLTVYFTFSRGGILAAVLAVMVYFALANNRLQRLVPAVIGLAAGFVLVLFAKSQSDLRDGLTNAAAHNQGDTTMWLTILVFIATGAVAALVLKRWGQLRFPDRLVPERKQAWIGSGVAVGLVLILLIVAGAPTKVSNGWESFKSADPPAHGSARLEAANGNGRYQYWASGVKQWQTEPVTGQGAGTFEFWWAETGDRSGFIRDTHSLYFQTLGESGLVGVILLFSLFGTICVVGFRRSFQRILGRRNPRAGGMAAATAGCVAFMVSAGLDWSWQLPAVVFPFLLLAATILGQSAGESRQFSPVKRLGLVVVPVIAVVLIAIPHTAAFMLDRSQEQARKGDLIGALDSARSAHTVSPSTAAPLLQEAALLEELGEPEAALEAARKATEAEPVNWRNWLILSTIEAREGDLEQAILDFREARRLNPRSQLFVPGSSPE